MLLVEYHHYLVYISKETSINPRALGLIGKVRSVLKSAEILEKNALKLLLMMQEVTIGLRVLPNILLESEHNLMEMVVDVEIMSFDWENRDVDHLTSTGKRFL